MPKKYNIPKKRKTIRTIKINNGSLTFDVDNNGKGYWFRNGKYITPNQLKFYNFYDESIKGNRALYTTYNGTPNGATEVYIPTLNYLYREHSRKYGEKIEESNKQEFKSNNKFITLRTKGKMNLATIPTNLLDTIAVNAGRAGVDVKTGLGLVGKESTFGGYSLPLNNTPVNVKYHPSGLVNNHEYYTNPEIDYLNSLNGKYNKNISPGEQLVIMEKQAASDMKYGTIKERTPHYNQYVMADAFERYGKNPKGYNPGQSNYTSMVTNIGNEVWGYKPIQYWYNTEGVNYYNKGREERRRLESRGKLTK